MPICIPERPHFNGSNGEIKVWQALKAQLPANAYLLHGYKITDHEGEHEIDTVVAWPGVGIVFIEIKGGYIERDADGGWTSTDRRRRKHVIDPADQAAKGMYAVRDFVVEHADFRGSWRSLWMVAFPDTDLDAVTFTHDLPRERIIDQFEVGSIKDAIQREARRQGLQAFASADNVEAFVTAMHDILDPDKMWIEESHKREVRVKELTEEQSVVLDQATRLKSFMVIGPAGSGKTFLAVEQARRLAAEGKKVALLCYSQGLSQHLVREVARLPIGERPVHTGTFHSLGEKVWRIEYPKQRPSEWWTDEYPKLLLEELRTNRRIQRFDAFIVDEGQDFAASWWDVINLGYSVNSDDSRIIVFADEDQALDPRASLHSLPVPQLSLNDNLRNTRQIGEFSSLLATTNPRHSGIEGPEIMYIECSADVAHDIAQEMVENLIEDGWQPGQIALVTTNHRHPIHKSRWDALEGDRVRYYQTFLDNEVFYAHVLGFKGLERPVVVVAVDGFKHDGMEKQSLYTAISRPRDLLVVCGDLEELTSVGGAAFGRALDSYKL